MTHLFKLKRIFFILCVLLISSSSIAALGQGAGASAPQAVSPSQGGIQGSFYLFLSDFRDLVQHGKYREVSEVSKFPFVFKGQLDIEGALEVERGEFINLLPVFLSLPSDVEIGEQSYEMTTKLSLVTTAEKPVYIAQNTVRLHDFVFKLIDGKWFFVMAYVRMDELMRNRE